MLIQPFITPVGTHFTAQMVDQPLLVFLVLLIGRFLRRQEKQHRIAVRSEDQQWGVDFVSLIALGTGEGVQLPRHDALEQVGSLRPVDDEPHLGGVDPPAARAGDVYGFGV
jgi:hypothetical protein